MAARGLAPAGEAVVQRGTARARAWLIMSAYRLAVPLARAVPPWLAYPLLDRVGDLLWLLNRPARRAVEANLLRVIGERGSRWRRAVRRTFQHGAGYYYSTFRTPSLTAAEVRELVTVHGWEHVETALAGGRGVIVATAHTTGVGMGGQAFTARGLATNVPVEPIEPPELLRLMLSVRTGVGMRPLPLGPRLGAELLAALRRNEMVVLVADRDLTGSGLTVPFFGAPARLPTGPALLALRSGAPILPAVCIVREGGGFEGFIDPPIEVLRSGDKRADLERVTRAVAARLEYHIRRSPEHWTVFQPVWDA